MNPTDPTIWPLLTYRDAAAAMTFLTEAFGFVLASSHTRDTDPAVVEHAELRWPEGGGVMLRTAHQDPSVSGSGQPGHDAVYVVHPDPESLLVRAVGCGAPVVRPLSDHGYGPGFTVSDPEGNMWSFGTYPGTPRVEQQVSPDFQALLNEWAAAIVANDVDRIARFADPDWVLVTPEGGPRPLAAFLALVASGDLVHTDMTFTVLDVRMVADTAMVLAHGINHGTWRGEPFAADEWVTEMFVRRAGRWRCTMSALTPKRPAFTDLTAVDAGVREDRALRHPVSMPVTLRTPTVVDAGALSQLLTRNRTYFQTGEPLGPPEVCTREFQAQVIRDSAAARRAGTAFLFLVEEDGRLVGRANLSSVIRGAFQSASVGYVVDQQHTGRGIATAALRELVRVAFAQLNLHRLQGETLVGNRASQRVLTRCGFVHYGTAPDYLRIQGRWQAHELYQLTNPGWRE